MANRASGELFRHFGEGEGSPDGAAWIKAKGATERDVDGWRGAFHRKESS